VRSRVVPSIAAMVMLSSLPAVAAADDPVIATNGSTLQAPANLVLPGGANQCLARPYIGPRDGTSTFINTGQSSCMWWSTEYGPTGQIIANTYVPRGSGVVTKVRVREGAAPAPLRFAIVSSGSRLCCTTKQVSEVVQPAADAVGEFTVNLPAGSGVGTQDGSQFNDILVVLVAGPGSLPVNDRGAHGLLFGSPADQAQAMFLHPALALGASNTDVGIMDGYEVLLQYDWCGQPMTLANPQPTTPPACLGQAPPPAAPPVAPVPPPVTPVVPPPPVLPAVAPLRVTSTTAAVRANRAALRLRCLLTTTCAGTLRLLPRPTAKAAAKKPSSYGTAKYKIAAGRSATIKVTLSRAGRTALRKRHDKLPILVTGGSGASAWTLKLTLKR
jgi:hypothetical protein